MNRWIPTTCMRCAVGCGHLQRGVDRGYGLDAVRGNAAHPTNRGMACKRGISETADPSGEWLTQPLVRKDEENGLKKGKRKVKQDGGGDRLVRTTWDVALSRIAERFGVALDHSPDAIAVLGSGQQTNEAVYALGKLARGGIGTRYYDANTTLCMASAVTAYYQSFGSDAPPPTYEDVPGADSHVVWGANPAVAHPVLFRWINQSASDGELLVVDPVQTKSADAADTHIQPAPGGDLALARAVLARFVETDRIDGQFVRQATTGFTDLVASLPPAETAATRAGVDLTTVDRLAALFEQSTLVYWGMGVNQSVRGTKTAQALIDLCLATGNLRPGSGPFSLTGQANSMGTRVCSSKGTWPGHRSFDAPEHRAVVSDAWDVPVERLPDDTGPGPVGIIEALENEVEVVYCVGTNPVAGLPDASSARKRLDDAFLVVQDAFRAETTEVADVVLPAATWGESSGTVMNMERTLSLVRPATDTPSGVRQDVDIIAALAARIAPGLLPSPPVDPEALFDEFRELTADTPADCSGISYDRLDDELAVRWPAPTTEQSGGYRYHASSTSEMETAPKTATIATETETATEIGSETEQWSFPTPDGRARFSSVDDTSRLPEPTDSTYPLTLTTARTADGYNTGVRSRSSPETPDPLVARLHPETIAAHTDCDSKTDPTESGERARVESRRASVDVRLAVDPSIPDGMIWLPIHHPMTNQLTVPATDPDSAEPNYKQCAVRLVACER